MDVPAETDRCKCWGNGGFFMREGRLCLLPRRAIREPILLFGSHCFLCSALYTLSASLDKQVVLAEEKPTRWLEV